MRWYEAKVEEGNPTVFRNVILFDFLELFTRQEVRSSERFLAACTKIFAERKIDENLTPELADAIVLLARQHGHPEARAWVDGYETYAPAQILSRIGQLSWTVPPDVTPSEEPSAHVGILLDEYESFGRKHSDSATRVFTTYALRGRFPRMLEHLRAGMPSSTEPFGSAAERSIAAEHPQILTGAVALFDRFFDKEGSFIEKKNRRPVGWKDYEPWLDVVRTHIKGRAAAAEGIAIARYGLDRDPLLVVPRFRSQPEASLAALRSWLRGEGDDDSGPRDEAERLLAFTELSTPEARETVEEWITSYVSNDGEFTAAFPKEPKKVWDRSQVVTTLLDSLGTEGDVFLRAGLELDASWPLEVIAVRKLVPTDPGAVAAALTARLDASEGPNPAVSGPSTRALASATSALADTPGAEVDGLFLRLISRGPVSDRARIISTCKERLGDDGLVDAVYRYISGKSRYTKSEYDIFLETLSGLENIEAGVLENLERLLAEKGNPDLVLWILKVLSYDLLERHGTKAALPLLRRMHADATGYETFRLETPTDSATGIPEKTAAETISFSNRVHALIAKLEASG